MRGRKPKPTALRILQGNPGHRPINVREPQHAPLEADVPPELVTGRLEVDEMARAEWLRLAPALIASGQVTQVDRGTLVGYCLKYAQWVALEREAARDPFVVNAGSGYAPNPAQGMANRVHALVIKAASELGITPSSRSRVSKVGAGDAAGPVVNPLARFLKRG